MSKRSKNIKELVNMAMVTLDFGIRTGTGLVRILDLIMPPISGRAIIPHQIILGTPVIDKSILIIS